MSGKFPRLPRDFAAALAGAGAGPALLITRNNLSFVEAVRTASPSLEWHVLTKDDLRGWTGRRLLDHLRSRRWDLVAIEDDPAEVRRRWDLYRGMLVAARARRRWLVGGGEGGTARAVHRVRDGLGLAGILCAEAFATAFALLSARRLLRRVDRSRLRPSPARAGAAVAVLRTDFWFGQRAGGSISHALGVLGGMRRLGLRPRLWTTSLLPELPPGVEQVEVLPAPRPALVEEAAMAGFNRTFLATVSPDAGSFGPGLVYHRHSVFSLAGLALARLLDVPLVLEVNASEVWARRAWSRLRFEGLADAMERAVFRRADRLVLISQALVPTVLERGGDRERIVVNPNGVDIDRFDPADPGTETRVSLGLPPDAIVIGFLGTFTRWHGVLFLAEEASRLLGEDERLHVLFVGDGEFRPEAERCVREAGVGDRVHFTGLLPPGRVPAHLAACDILVSPHLPLEDGTEYFVSPIKLFEYMAAGRPVVASRIGQTPEILEDGRTGLLHPPGDGSAFRAAVLRLASDPDLRRSLAGAGRAVVEERYTWEANVRRSLAGLVELPPSGS